jgi:hypothetical protein
LKEGSDGACFGFIREEVDVLGHDDVGRDAEALLFADLFEDYLSDVFGGVGLQEGLTAVTAKGDEMEIPSFLVTFETLWHGCASSLHPTLRKGAKDGAPFLWWRGEWSKTKTTATAQRKGRCVGFSLSWFASLLFQRGWG